MTERSIHSAIQVACTLLTANGYNLLIPNACIEEIFKPTSFGAEHLTAWCDYSTLFRGNKIYLLQLEYFTHDNPGNSLPARIAVRLKKNAAFPHLPDLAISTTTIPKTVQASDFSLEKAYQPRKTHPLAMSYVNINDKPAFIPDINRLFREFSLQLAKLTA